MKSNRNIPINIRATKKKKSKAKKLVKVLMVLVAAAAAVYLLINSGAFKAIKSSVLAFSEKFSDSAGKTPEPTSKPAKSTGQGQGTNKGNTAAGLSDDPIEPPVVDVNEKDVKVLKEQLKDYLKKYQGQYGIHYTNLVTGTEFGINDSDVYIAASTVKVPINLYLFKKIESRAVKPDTVMTYTKGDYEGGTGSIQYKEIGTKFTVRELSKLSIEQSDNVAINMLIRLIGRQNYKNYMKQMGGKVVTSENVSNPKDMALYMKKVYAFYKNNPELGGELMGYLQNTIYNDRIPKLLPKEVKVAHKTGNQVGAVHDVGIVFTEKPYVISIMTKDIIEKESYGVIANISKMVYDYVK